MIVGLGTTANEKLSQIAPTVIGTAGAIGTGVAVGSGALVAGSLAIPIIGAAIAGVTLVIGMWLSSISKHNAEKAAATKIVNEAEPYLQQNLAAYNSISSPTQADKDQALYNYDNIWGQVVAACSNANLEDAGKRCVADRSDGGRWVWHEYYRDPIANSTVVSVSASITGQVQEALGGTSLLVIGAGLLGAFVLLGGLD